MDYKEQQLQSFLDDLETHNRDDEQKEWNYVYETEEWFEVYLNRIYDKTFKDEYDAYFHLLNRLYSKADENFLPF